MDFLKNIDKENTMLVNMLYNRGSKDTEYVDTLDIIYRDVRTNEKKLHTIKNPELDIYFVKEEFRDYDYNKPFIELDKTEKHTCAARSIPWYIAKQAGKEYIDMLTQLRETGNFRDINKIHMYPYVFGSDMDVESFYRINWMLNYDNDCSKELTKSFLDIEVDSIEITGFPRDGECPINAVTIVDGTGRAVYTFLLDNPNNPQVAEFVNDIDNFIDELHEDFDDVYGELDYNIYMYQDELQMLKDLFKLINTLKRDFLMIWNMAFDIPYLIARVKELGGDPNDVMTHPDFFNKVCKFIKDTRNFQVSNKGDRFDLSSYTKFMDQMILYAATRKGQKELSSYSLNNIARVELGDTKLDYSDEADIKTLPYVNYRKFVKYNIKDTLLQFGLENKVNDLDNLYLRSYLNCCPYDKVFKQTFMLKRRAYYEYLLQGNILGNNVNVFNTESSSFSGAVNLLPIYS